MCGNTFIFPLLLFAILARILVEQTCLAEILEGIAAFWLAHEQSDV